MATELRTPQTGGGDGQPSSLSTLFPGETIVLSTGTTVRVRPWGARAILHEVPALLGRLFAQVSPLQRVTTADSAWLIANIPLIFERAAQELEALVKFTTKLPAEAFTDDPPPAGVGLTGEEFIQLTEAMFRVNQSFFAGLNRLRSAVVPPTGPAPSSPSSGPGSDSMT